MIHSCKPKISRNTFMPIYVLSFKDAVTLVRKYFRLHAHEPPDRIYAELLGYTRPVASGRADKRNMKPKTAIWFVYRVA